MLARFLLGREPWELPVFFAAGAFSNGVEAILNGTIDMDTTELKLMLVQDTFTFDPDDQFVDDGDANDLASHECNATGYTGGFAGADRNVCAVTVTEQTANNRVVCIPTDETYSAIGGAANNTLEGAALIREITNDAASIPIAWLEFTATVTTNGSDITVDNDGTNGNIRFTV